MKKHKIDILELSKETLAKIIEMYAGNALTLDGLWFTKVEENFGLDAAIEIDTKAWREYGMMEARRIKKVLEISETGTQALAKALNFQVWVRAIGMEYEFPEVSQNKLVLNVTDCRPQKARIRKGLGEFACKPVGIALFEEFAKVINPQFKMKCLVCPPDPHPPDLWCSWKFTLEE